jgi:hypothetical protein
VSYDIVFLRREPGQSWEEAFAARQDGIEDTGSSIRRLDPGEVETWERLVPRVEAVLGPVEVVDEGVMRELTHAPTGIELTMSAEEISITVPYGPTGGAALELMEKVYEIARIVEDETELQGYDIQLDEPVSDAVAGARREARTAIESDEDDDTPAPPRRAPVPAFDEEPAPAPPRQAAARAPWWQFWRR